VYKKLSSGQRLPQRVAAQIRGLIRSKKLKPGDKLPNEHELTRLFGVSRPTVREAVKLLASGNIVHIARGRGTFVSETPGIASDPLGLDLVSTWNLGAFLLEVRGIVEPTVARLAAERSRDADIDGLDRRVAEGEQALASSERWKAAELGFHRAVAQASRNPVIMRLLPVISEAILRTLRRGPATPADRREALVEHRRILAAIRARSPVGASRAMRRHLRESFRRSMRLGSGET
jgi:DNA-binding FadR family transcriptional regulator